MDSGQNQSKHLWNQMVVGILGPFFLYFEQVTDLVKNLKSLTFIMCQTRLVEIKA